MTGTISAADVGQCRVSERFPCDVPVSCQPPSARGGGGREWPARVRNISTKGLCLVLRRRFEPGAGLAIEMPGESPSTMLARVVSVRAEADGCWALGCAFVSPLADEEVQGVLRPVAPGATDAAAGRPFVADVLFRGALPGGGVVRRLIRKLYLAASSWPLPAGLVIGLRFQAFSAAPVARVRVDACRAAEERRVMECTFLDAAPAGVTREGRAAARSRS